MTMKKMTPSELHEDGSGGGNDNDGENMTASGK